MARTSFAFVFMDECSYEPLDLISLTGVLVPLEKYVSVRDAMCQLAWNILSPEKNRIPQPVELHASDLLRDRTDTDRLAVYATVVKIIQEHRFLIYRTTYLNRGDLNRIFKGDPKMYGLNFGNIMGWLERIMENTLVIPVMDGVPSQKVSGKKPPRIDGTLIRAFAQRVRMIHQIRQSESGSGMLSIKNAKNLGEPIFGDSAYSTFLQLVDLVSYLLLQVERSDLEPDKPMSEFRQDVVAQGRKLEFASSRGRMKINGV